MHEMNVFYYAFYALHYNTENNNVSLPTKY